MAEISCRFFAVCAIITSPSLYFARNTAASTAPESTTGALSITPVTFDSAFWMMAIGGGLVGLVVRTLAQALVYDAAFQDMRGRPASFRESMHRVLTRLAPIISLAVGLGVMIVAPWAGLWIALYVARSSGMIGFSTQHFLILGLGALLLIVNMAFVWVLAVVSIPVCLIENLGPIASFWRSAALTKGYRWRIFAVFSLVAGIGWAIGWALSALLTEGATMAAGPRMTALLAFLLDAISLGFLAVVTIVIYRDLRVAKEGIDADPIVIAG